METFAIILFLIFLVALYYAIKVTIDGLSKPFDTTAYDEYLEKKLKPIKINLYPTKIYKQKYDTLKGMRYKKK